MASDHDSAAVFTTFQAIVFVPSMVVGLLILLASWLTILDALASLSNKFHEYRARQGINHVPAQSTESGVENGVAGNGMFESPRIGWHAADVRQGP